ncbi:MAG: 1-acyl-sn-glycerol-3-phosphate acyltransferase [Anaerolineales bacterium]|nr:1-acyl-sn-glycerol-3-phosphate acyltransferase [Anaerolineales bacterium]
MTTADAYTTPGRQLIRRLLKALSVPAFALLTDLEITGQENLPPTGPLIMVGNHFSFIDPVCFVRLAPWPMEFLGGAHMPHAPGWAKIIPLLWGYHPLYRGTGATDSLKTAVEILKRGGVLGVFPEAGNWASVLRPARPGTALIATLSGAPLLPVGLVGLNDVFPCLVRGRRARIRFQIGKPFGPFRASGRGRERREQLEEIGHEIMRRIAELIPPERRGYYSDDPLLRAAARNSGQYPWSDKIEGQVEGSIR